MAERVAIVAVAQTKYHPNRNEVNEGELAYEAIERVLAGPAGDGAHLR